MDSRKLIKEWCSEFELFPPIYASQATQADHTKDCEQSKPDLDWVQLPIGSVTIPAGTTISQSSIEAWRERGVNFEFMPPEQCPVIDYKKMKEEGRCQQCGLLLPMSAFGMGDCPRCNP